jgi:hypothetical protein
VQQRDAAPGTGEQDVQLSLANRVLSP